MNDTLRKHSTYDTARHAKIDVHKTWSQIAEEVGLSEQYVQDILHGRRPGYQVRGKIAEALRITVEDLWPPEEERASA